MDQWRFIMRILNKEMLTDTMIRNELAGMPTTVTILSIIIVDLPNGLKRPHLLSINSSNSDKKLKSVWCELDNFLFHIKTLLANQNN